MQQRLTELATCLNAERCRISCAPSEPRALRTFFSLLLQAASLCCGVVVSSPGLRASSGGRLPEALFMVFRLESKGAKVCKSCRSRQELSKAYFILEIFTCKIWRRYSRERALKNFKFHSHPGNLISYPYHTAVPMLLAEFPHLLHILPNFGGLVLGCIEADICEEIFIKFHLILF